MELKCPECGSINIEPTKATEMEDVHGLSPYECKDCGYVGAFDFRDIMDAYHAWKVNAAI